MLIDDLKWAVSSPSLIKDNALFDENFINLDEQNIPQNAKDIVLNRSRKNLGSYFEKLIEVACLSDNQTNIIKTNYQVIKEKETFGEFDLILKRAQEFFHVELAVKFYLGTKECKEISDFIGPGKRDRFDLKIDKIVDKQSSLSKTIEAQEALQNIGIKKVTPKIYLKGALFYPINLFRNNTFPAIKNINPYHLKGWWAHEKYLNELDNECLWSPLEKPHQLSLKNHQKPMSFEEIKTYIKNKSWPVMVVRLDRNLKAIDRGFVMPNEW